MKRSAVCCALSVLLLLLLFGCTSQEESQAAVSDAVLQAFALQEEEAVEKLGLSGDPTMIERSNHIYKGSSTWCGIEMDTKFVFKNGKHYSFSATKTYDGSEKTQTLAQDCVAQLKEQLGNPNACENLNRETNNGISYGA